MQFFRRGRVKSCGGVVGLGVLAERKDAKRSGAKGAVVVHLALDIPELRAERSKEEQAVFEDGSTDGKAGQEVVKLILLWLVLLIGGVKNP